MPELAEVEYYRRRWAVAEGSRVEQVFLHAGKRVFRGVDTAALVAGLIGEPMVEHGHTGNRCTIGLASGTGWGAFGDDGEVVLRGGRRRRWRGMIICVWFWIVAGFWCFGIRGCLGEFYMRLEKSIRSGCRACPGGALGWVYLSEWMLFLIAVEGLRLRGYF